MQFMTSMLSALANWQIGELTCMLSELANYKIRDYP